ncbi:MAG: hypothetical protein GY850_19410 [bacterium]|nr:hypothetical protein [bacterium]
MILYLTEARAAGKVVLGTVQGYVHDIGKNLVGGCVIAQNFAGKISADAYAENACEAMA